MDRKAGKMVFKNLKGRCRDELGQILGHFEVSKLATMKGNSQQKYLFNTTELYSHIQSSPG